MPETPAVPPQPAGSVAGMSVLGKARLILEAFQLDDVNVSLTTLTARTGVPKATVFRLCRELTAWGMLERSGTDYRLGMRAFELGSRVPRFRVLRDVVRPYMETLHNTTKEAVHLAVLDGLDVLYLEKVAGGPKVARPSRIAGRMPSHSTATGKALLAHSPVTVVEQAVERGLERITPLTVVLPGVLQEQLRGVRIDGYATEFEETTLGYCSVAVPLFGASGLLLASVSITAPMFRADVAFYASSLINVSKKVTSSNAIN